MLNQVHVCRVWELHEYGKAQKGPREISAFVVSGDFGRASFLAGQVGDAWFDATGVECDWSVEVAPLVGADDPDHLIVRAAREKAGGEYA